MGDKWLIGSKAIVLYLRTVMDLSSDSQIAWQRVRRWKKYGLPIEKMPNGRPYLDERIFIDWWRRYKKKMAELGITHDGNSQ